MAAQIDPERTETTTLQRFADFTGKRVLEVGSGDGRLTWRYANAARLVAGIDLETDDLRVALLDRPANLAQKAVFARADAVHLPFQAGTFDMALFAWSF